MNDRKEEDRRNIKVGHKEKQRGNQESEKKGRVWPKEWEYRRCWEGDKGRREGGGGRNNETIFSGTRKLAECSAYIH